MIMISLFIFLSGLIMPYMDIISNITEAAISINVLILLLLRNMSLGNEDVNDVSFYTMTSNTTSMCTDYEVHPTILSYGFLSFYYFPLFLTGIGCMAWIVSHIR